MVAVIEKKKKKSTTPKQRGIGNKVGNTFQSLKSYEASKRYYLKESNFFYVHYFFKWLLVKV